MLEGPGSPIPACAGVERYVRTTRGPKLLAISLTPPSVSYINLTFGDIVSLLPFAGSSYAT